MDARCGNTFEIVFCLFPFFALLYSCQELYRDLHVDQCVLCIFFYLAVSSVFLEGRFLSLRAATMVCVVIHFFETF